MQFFWFSVISFYHRFQTFQQKMRLTVRRKSEVIPIPDIRERNDRPKDKQPKHQVTSTIQRQMVQKFVKELSDSAKQPDRSDSAEHTATEQVEAASREIVHEAFQLPRGFSHRTHYTESTEHLQPEQPISPRPTSEIPRQRTETVRARPDTTPAPTPQEQGRRAYIQQAAKATTTPPITPESPQERPTPATPTPENVPRQNLQSPRQRADDFRTRVETRTPQSTPAPTPQEQGRRAYVQQAAKAAAAPRTVPPEQPQNYHTTPEVSPQENVPHQNLQSPRHRTNDFRTRPESRAAQSVPAPTPQEQGRRAYVQQAESSGGTADHARIAAEISYHTNYANTKERAATGTGNTPVTRRRCTLTP